MTQPHTLSEDWQPTPGDMEYAKSKGFCEAQILEEAESFKRHFTVGPGYKTKWKLWSTGNGAWGTWMQKANKWPAWKVEQAEPKKEWYEAPSRVSPDDVKSPTRNIPKPRVKKIPELGKLGPQGRQRIIDRIAADEPEKPKLEIKPLYVPMPDHLRGKILAPKGPKKASHG